MPLSATVSSFILFVNFPKLVIAFHQRPLYYDDLEIRDYNDDDADEHIYDDSVRNRYKNIFRWVITVTSPIVIGILVEVWYMKSDFANDNATGVNSAHGGPLYMSPSTAAALAIMISLATGYLRGSIIFGKMLMFILKYFKRREIAKRRYHNAQVARDEANNVGVTVDTREDEEMRTMLLSASTQPRRVRSHSDLSAGNLDQSHVIIGNEIFN